MNLFVSFMLRAISVFIKDWILYAEQDSNHCFISTVSELRRPKATAARKSPPRTTWDLLSLPETSRASGPVWSWGENIVPHSQGRPAINMSLVSLLAKLSSVPQST